MNSLAATGEWNSRPKACQCSTPFGDIDEFTRLGWLGREAVHGYAVLNAFRRH